MRKETTEVTEDEELTTLGILSAHFARRYHFICLGLTARSCLSPPLLPSSLRSSGA